MDIFAIGWPTHLWVGARLFLCGAGVSPALCSRDGRTTISNRAPSPLKRRGTQVECAGALRLTQGSPLNFSFDYQTSPPRSAGPRHALWPSLIAWGVIFASAAALIVRPRW